MYMYIYMYFLNLFILNNQQQEKTVTELAEMIGPGYSEEISLFLYSVPRKHILD